MQNLLNRPVLIILLVNRFMRAEISKTERFSSPGKINPFSKTPSLAHALLWGILKTWPDFPEEGRSNADITEWSFLIEVEPRCRAGLMSTINQLPLLIVLMFDNAIAAATDLYAPSPSAIVQSVTKQIITNYQRQWNTTGTSMQFRERLHSGRKDAQTSVCKPRAALYLEIVKQGFLE